MSVRIIVDSACDISQEEAKKLGVEIIPLKTTFGDVEYLDSIDLTHDAFFEKLVETDEFPHTSQIPPIEYEDRFEAVKEAGDTAVCITISSKISGCYQNAVMTALDYEDVIWVVDSEIACMGERLIVELAVRLRDEGKSAKEIAAVLDEEKKNLYLIALLDTLEYLKRGGRISAAAAMIGSVLSIKPVISFEEGEVIVLGKARGSRNGTNLMTELIEKAGGIDFDMPYSLAYSGLSDHMLRKYMKDQKQLYIDHCSEEDIPITSIGAAIGVHIGPGAIGAAFFKKKS